MRAFDKLLEAMSRQQPERRPKIRYRIVGTIVFKNPNGTGDKHENNINEVVYAHSPEQAEGAVAKKIADKRGFRYFNYYKGRAHTITVEPEPPPPPTRLPYKDDEQLEMDF